MIAGMLLNSVDNSPSLLGAYQCAIDAMKSKLPFARRVARQEFLNYRITLLSKSDENAGSLNEERIQLNLRLKRELNDYEHVNKVPFLSRGVPWRGATCPVTT